MKITPEKITKLNPNEIFVFGSNLEGLHGGGAAAYAMYFGAIWGQGTGLQGQTYAIPTLSEPGGLKEHMLPLPTIGKYVNKFIKFAKAHPQYTFLVTPIGCGIAGFTPQEIAPLFKKAVGIENITLPQSFIEYFNLSNMIKESIEKCLSERKQYDIVNLKQVKQVPKYLYHVSNPIFRNNILKQGLIPNVGDSYLCHAEDYIDNTEDLPKCIFLSPKSNYDSTYDDDRWIIDTNFLDKNAIYYDFDRSMKDSFVYLKPIPSEALQLIYKGNYSLNENITNNISYKQEGNLIKFYYNNIECGGAIFEAHWIEDIDSEYSDSIEDFSPNILRYFNNSEKIVNIEDVWVNKEFQGKGLFKQIFSVFINKMNEKYNQYILRAHSDNGFLNDILEKIYSSYGFKAVQQTKNDGIIMIKI